MTKHQFVADRIREHALNLTKFANGYADSDETRFLLSVASSMANIAEELTKEPKPAMAPGDTRPKFGPKPSSTVLSPKPAPVMPPQGQANDPALAKIKALAHTKMKVLDNNPYHMLGVGLKPLPVIDVTK